MLRRPRRTGSGPRRGAGRARPRRALESAGARRAPEILDLRRSPCGPPRRATVVGACRPSGRVSSSVRASSSIRFGGRSATPCEAIVRRRSTGSPPAPRSSSSVIVSAISCFNAADRVHSPRGHSRRRRRRHVHGRRPRRGRPDRDGQGADRRPPGGVRARGGRARSARASSSASRTGRPSPRTRCSSGRARARPSSRPQGSSTCCTCGARRARTSTGSATHHPEPLVPLDRCFGSTSAWARRAFSAARPRVAAGDRRGGGRRLPALLVPRPEPRARRRGRAAAEAARGPRRRLARGRARVPRVRACVDDSDRRVPRPLAGRLPRPRSRRVALRRGLPEPLVMRSSGGVATIAEAAAHPAFALLSGPAAGASGRDARRSAAGVEDAIHWTWAARRPTWR